MNDLLGRLDSSPHESKTLNAPMINTVNYPGANRDYGLRNDAVESDDKKRDDIIARSTKYYDLPTYHLVADGVTTTAGRQGAIVGPDGRTFGVVDRGPRAHREDHVAFPPSTRHSRSRTV